MKKKILLTGATGALGGELLLRLLAEGDDVVCLVRPLYGKEAGERLPEKAREAEGVSVIGGDVSRPLCGVSSTVLLRFQEERITHFLHCAASIKFNDETTVRATNINGVGNALALADALGIENFLHISTTYVAGGARELLESDAPRDASHPPRNVYEASKQHGEALVREWGNRGEGRRYGIVRPSILIGREDGTTPTLDGYYGYFSPLHRIAEAMRRRAVGGKRLPSEVAVSNDGSVRLPIALLRSESSTLNLVPVDWVAATVVKLLLLPAENRAYHLIDTTPMRVRDVIDGSLEYLRVDGTIRTDWPERHEEALRAQSPLLATLQERVDTIHREYRPYVTHEAAFAHGSAAAALGALFTPAPHIGASFLRKSLGYAVAQWGTSAGNPVNAEQLASA